jgi:hypothetical protein
MLLLEIRITCFVYTYDRVDHAHMPAGWQDSSLYVHLILSMLAGIFIRVYLLAGHVKSSLSPAFQRNSRLGMLVITYCKDICPARNSPVPGTNLKDELYVS